MDEIQKRKSIEGNSGGEAESNRRRVGTIVHDDRGMASVEWHDAPANLERPVLEILDGTGLALKNDDVSCDPYSHTATFPRSRPGNTTRTDLRKLSEWIKMKRALDERKLRGGDDDDDDNNR